MKDQEMIRTTLDLPAELKNKFHSDCYAKGLTMRAVLQSLIENYLKTAKKDKK